MLYDSGSILTLCRHDWALQAGCPSKEFSVYIKGLAHGYKKLVTRENEVVLLDTTREEVGVRAIGMDELTRETRGMDLTRVYQQFPEVPMSELERPEGQVDLLLGLDYAGYLPKVEKIQGHLLLLRS